VCESGHTCVCLVMTVSADVWSVCCLAVLYL